MRYFFLFLCILFFPGSKSFPQRISKKQTTSVQNSPNLKRSKIYSKHWFGELPLPEKNKQSLLIHDIFIISFDTEKRFPWWVAYSLSPALVWGKLKAKRKYVIDPYLSPQTSLSFKDYKGASTCDGQSKTAYDKGHLAPVGSFKASPYSYQAQYLSNIVPQKRKLNQGPWKNVEELVRKFVKKGNELKILTGPIYGKEGKDKTPACWKAVQGKLEQIPTAYWKIVAFKDKSKIKVCSFLMPQNIKSNKIKAKQFIISKEKLKEKLVGFKPLQNTKYPVVNDCHFLL